MFVNLQEILVIIALVGAVYLLVQHFGWLRGGSSSGCSATGCDCAPLKKELKAGNR